MPDIKIYKDITVLPIDDIKPYWRNPRRNDKTVEALKAVIPVVGFNVPIYVDKDYVIIKGHARYRAATQLGMKELPCIISENSDEQNRLDRVADNKVSELAEWDVGELRYELENIDFDLESIGFDMPKDDLMEAEYGQEEFNDVKDEDFAKSYAKIIESQQVQDKDIINSFKSDSNDTIVPTERKDRKVMRVTCPHCGEPLVFDLA